ncbi:hypothetical protein ABPG77_003317 [Micractinium sp. CCAP 211/92]
MTEEGFFAAEAPSAAGSAPAHAHLWLTSEDQQAWLALRSQMPVLTFACFVAFNAVSYLSVRMINRKGAITARSDKATIQYGSTAATHALLSLAAAAYAAVHQKLDRTCGDRLFCHDDLSARLFMMHAGFALYDFLFWQNNARFLRPWNEMLLLNDVVTLLQGVAYLLYPCRLSLLLLPVQQMLSVAALADSARRFCAAFGVPWALRFKLQLGFVGAHFIQAAGAAGIAGFAYWWIRQHNLWRLKLPEGMGLFNNVYGLILLAGCFIQFLIYSKWLATSLEMTSRLLNLERGRMAAGGKGSAKTQAAVKTLSAGSKKGRARR